MYIGVDYYPEHWPEERWSTDARLMQEAGFNVVRLGEFDWVNMEPEDGVFTFAKWDRALAALAERGLSAILCTPTAVMPAWVAHKHPETLALQKDGTRLTWGVRKNNCFSSGTYRFLSQRITRAMAEHFADTPNVIGWQTDNEFGNPFCYCASCRADFQHWLHRKYETLDELNRAWGTHFWGHRIQSWEEITIPDDATSHNPSACLDWQRHFSWMNVRFQHEQVEILRAVCPRHFITHNFMGLFPELDYYDLAKDLDVVSWDNYPVWGAPEVRYDSSMAADLMRGLLARNFWIMEQTAGPGGWGAYGRNPRPGELRNVCYQQLAHGADAQVWFRWRTCTAGREQYWHGLLGHDGRALRRYQEAAQTAGEYRTLEKALAGTTVKADVAILYDYDSLWAVRIQPGYSGNDYTTAVRRFYRALFRAGVNVDLIPPTADFSLYKAVFAPDLCVLPDALAERLAAYVERGGVLLSDCRTGVKDATGLCHERTLPGLLAPVFGIEIQEYDAVPGNVTHAVSGRAPIAGSFNATLSTDWIIPGTAEVLASYQDWHLQAYAAVTRNRCGEGWGYYVGTVAKEDAFYDAVVAAVLASAAVRAPVTPPAGVEVSRRQGPKADLLFLINHTEEPKTVTVPAGKAELLSGKKTRREFVLERFGVAVITL
jgi:beta-galactosidase